jgi:hypothetical protein
VEDRLYRRWLVAGYFEADPASGKTPFTIVIPPPNVTGQLHLVHAFQHTLGRPLAEAAGDAVRDSQVRVHLAEMSSAPRQPPLPSSPQWKWPEHGSKWTSPVPSTWSPSADAWQETSAPRRKHNSRPTPGSRTTPSLSKHPKQ